MEVLVWVYKGNDSKSQKVPHTKITANQQKMLM
jgi:hypothetical protein